MRLRNGEAKRVAWNVEWTEWTSMDFQFAGSEKVKESHSNSWFLSEYFWLKLTAS